MALSPERRRADCVIAVKNLCKDLNRAGADPIWSPSQLRLYINTKFTVDDGLDSLTFHSFELLLRDLEGKLVALRGNQAAEQDLYNRPAIRALERSAEAAERSK
jgi:hypothetical protein